MQQMRPHLSVELILPSMQGYERVAMACSASFAHLNGLPPDRVEDLKTIVAEAASNAIQHGNGGRVESRVVIRFESEPGAVTVSVIDQGKGFDNTIKDPDIERIIDNLDAPVGFGLFLIRKLADKVVYAANPEGGHRVDMRIAIPS